MRVLSFEFYFRSVKAIVVALNFPLSTLNFQLSNSEVINHPVK